MFSFDQPLFCTTHGKSSAPALPISGLQGAAPHKLNVFNYEIASPSVDHSPGAHRDVRFEHFIFVISICNCLETKEKAAPKEQLAIQNAAEMPQCAGCAQDSALYSIIYSRRSPVVRRLRRAVGVFDERTFAWHKVKI